MRSGASSDGHSRDTESVGDEEELTTIDDKRKSKKGLKLGVLLSRDKDKDKSKKEKVNAYPSNILSFY